MRHCQHCVSVRWPSLSSHRAMLVSNEFSKYAHNTIAQPGPFTICKPFPRVFTYAFRDTWEKPGKGVDAIHTGLSTHPTLMKIQLYLCIRSRCFWLEATPNLYDTLFFSRQSEGHQNQSCCQWKPDREADPWTARRKPKVNGAVENGWSAYHCSRGTRTTADGGSVGRR